MNRIYKNASRVLVWLGSDNEGAATAAFKLEQELDEIFRDAEKHQQFRIDNTTKLERSSRALWAPLHNLTNVFWVSPELLRCSTLYACSGRI